MFQALIQMEKRLSELARQQLRMVQIGVISALDIEKPRARVRFPDTNIESDWLWIIGNSELRVGRRVLVLYFPVDEGDGFILGGIG